MKMMLLRRVVLLFCLLVVSTSGSATLTIDITQGVEGALPIAIVPFHWEGAEALPEDITAVIKSDLQRSGRFAPLPEQDLIARPFEGKQIKFQNWRVLNVDNLVVGYVTYDQAKNIYRVQFQLFDVYKENQLTGYSFQTSAGNLRRIAHRISDIIFETLMGIRGAFDTHIAYITVGENDKAQKIYHLAIADSDGHNEQVIYESTQPILSPSWSPDGRHIAYVSYRRGRPELYLQNIDTKKLRRVASYQGLNNAPAWSPKGDSLAMTLSKDGNPEIYIMNMKNNELTRITHNYAIDTEPVWLPDGRSLIFTSDRGGGPQLYRIKIGRSGAVGTAERITYEGNYNARPSVSPDGKKIAMVHQREGDFHIAVLDTETEHLTILTESKLDESPSFAPNGSMIIYATEHDNRGVLSAVSVDGSAKQRLSFQQGDVREPAWSPFRTNY